jgi:hypothetical protein
MMLALSSSVITQRNRSSITSQYTVRLQDLNFELPALQTPLAENKMRTERWAVLTIALIDARTDGV